MSESLDYLNEQLQDPEIRKGYERIKGAIIQKQISKAQQMLKDGKSISEIMEVLL